jgi:hypothetical protein
VYGQNNEGDYSKASNCFAQIEAQGRYIEDLAAALGEQNALNLPAGIKKIVGNIAFTLAVTNIKFGNEYGELTLFMKMGIPQQSRTLIFGASGIKISYEGDLIGDVKLALLKDISINMGNMGEIIFKGSLDANGASQSKTYVSLECNGSFKELSLDADIILNPNTFHLAGNDEPVTSSFHTLIHDWNNWIIETSFPAFEIKGADGFEFRVSNATLDLSDEENPVKFNPDSEYINNPAYFSLPDRNLWRGLYIDEFTVTLPPCFKNKNNNERLIISASHLLIDENGITGNISGKNVLPIESGDASGWAFSVTDFRLSFLANNIKGFGFGGEIDIPLSEKSQLRPYEAYISNNEYLFTVGLGENMDFDLFGQTKLNIDRTSYIQILLKNSQFCPKLVLNGSMELNSSGLRMEQIVFRKLAIATESPVFSVESVEYGGDVKLNNFPVTISDIRFTAAENSAALGFDLKINLMSEKIAAGTRLRMETAREDRKWKFKGLSIDAIKLDNIQMAGFSLNGEIRTEKDHPIYGNYFGGEIKATFGALSSALSVDVVAVFGCKDFRYWYVEGQVMLGTGIPIGPVFLTGFTGGAYYKMSATGKSGIYAYEPNNDYSLGVKAGVAYGIGAKVVTGNALFEMNFLSSGGIKNMKFYCTAQMMLLASKYKPDLAGLDKMRSKAQESNANTSGSYADNLPGGMSGTDVAKKILSGVDLSAGISAFLTMDYDFVTKTFDAEFKIMVSTPGNFLCGAGNNNEAGWVKLYCSPDTWYIHAGTPSNPIGLKVGLGQFSLSAQAYFMLGDKLEEPAPPPQEVLDILKITPEQADYMKSTSLMKEGKGVAFGTHLSFDTGNMTFLILYARFAAGIGFDIMLRDMSDYYCEGSNTPVGINGWYANGQSYAYLLGELGVNIKILSIKKKIPVISGATASLLQARFPNPSWIGGRIAVKLNILGGLIKADMSMKMSFGDDCKLVNKNDDYSPLEMPVIADLTPAMNETDVDVFLSPQATFNMSMGESFSVEDEDGNTQSYRIKLEDFYISDETNKRIEGTIKWNSQYNTATFESKEILPPYKNLKVSVSVNFEEYINGAWVKVMQSGKPAREQKEASFKTGGAPNYIPLTNIAYCYPVVGQKNFYKSESNSGYVQLKKGQTYLFPDNFTYNAVFTKKDGTLDKADFKYSSGDSRINYIIPSTNNKTDYTLSFVALASGAGEQTAQTVTTASTITDSEGESFSIDYTQQAAQKITKDGSLEVLNYQFHTSEHNTLEQKLSSIRVESGSRYVNTDVRSLLLSSTDNYELFDEAELIGSIYTANIPLISVEAILDDDYYNKDIAPLIYNLFPYQGIKITERDINVYGFPPQRAFPLYDGYLSYISSDVYDSFKSKLIPFMYELPFYYSLDYYELKTKAVNSFDKGINMQPLMPLIESGFPFIRNGNYKTHIKYVLPGGKAGTSKQINYINTLNVR